MKKRILTLTLAVLFLLALAVPAGAVNGTIGSSGGTGVTALSYNVDSNFMVTIPDNIAAGNTGSAAVTLAANALINTGKKLTIAVNGGTNYSNGYRMKTGTADYLEYTLSYKVNEETVKTISTEGTTILTVNAGEQNAKTVTLTYETGIATIAGEYKDTLTFTVSVVDQ